MAIKDVTPMHQEDPDNPDRIDLREQLQVDMEEHFSEKLKAAESLPVTVRISLIDLLRAESSTTAEVIASLKLEDETREEDEG